MSSKMQISLAHIYVKPSAMNIDTVSFYLHVYIHFKLCENDTILKESYVYWTVCHCDS